MYDWITLHLKLTQKWTNYILQSFKYIYIKDISHHWVYWWQNTFDHGLELITLEFGSVSLLNQTQLHMWINQNTLKFKGQLNQEKALEVVILNW